MRVDLSVLNPEQRHAVTAGEGPLLVLAGAGTGKTRVITYRIAHLMCSGVGPDRILGITFTNRAAREMQRRLDRMYPDLDCRPCLSTFHALGHRILKTEHRRFRYRARFPIYDESDARATLTDILRELAGMGLAERDQERTAATISRWKSRFVSPEEALDQAADDDEFFLARAYARYRDRLESLNAVDFDDLIYRPVRLFREDDEAREHWSHRFDYVLVDEYQDTNTAQYRFAQILAGERQNICAVGDDDQSIYAFRGAEVERILSFRRDFPRTQVITLEKNYRSVGTILEAANAVIQNNPNRHTKRLQSVRGPGETIPFLTLENEFDEAEEVVMAAKEARRRGLLYADQAILLRTANQSGPFEEKLRFYQIPYTIIGGRSFFDRREVRDVLAYLRLLYDPDDDISALRILNTPRRGWGSSHRQRLDDWARERSQSIMTALRSVRDIPGISGSARQGAEDLVSVFGVARAALPQGATGATRDLLEAIGYDPWLRERSQDGLELESRRRAVEFLLESLTRHETKRGRGTLDDFLRQISLRDHPEDKEAPQDQITLLTFHGAKGLEFRVVYLVGIEDGLIPHRRALAEDPTAGLEEERRLFYVAITRAMDRLVMTRAARRRHFGREVETTESRFSVEIPSHLLNRSLPSADDATPVDAETAAGFLEALKNRFRDDPHSVPRQDGV